MADGYPSKQDTHLYAPLGEPLNWTAKLIENHLPFDDLPQEIAYQTCSIQEDRLFHIVKPCYQEGHTWGLTLCNQGPRYEFEVGEHEANCPRCLGKWKENYA